VDEQERARDVHARGSTDVTAETTGTTVDSSGACTDKAGNPAAGTSFGPIKIDKTAPTIEASARTLPLPGAVYSAGTWTNKSVRVTFTCTDTGGSGTQTDTASGDTDVTAETSASGTTVNSGGTCTDQAGNPATGASFGPVMIDKTAPTITDEHATSSPNGAGWYRANVTNKFKASDSLSGPDSACEVAFPDPVAGGRTQLKETSSEGTAVTVESDDCTDVAGNKADAITSEEFQIDKSDPTSSADSPTATNQSPFSVAYSASDQALLSGLAKVELYVRTPQVGTGYVLAATDNTPGDTGSLSYTPSVEGTYRFYTVSYDVAGNVESSPVSYDTVTEVETGTPDVTTIFDITAPVTTDDSDGNWHNTAVTVKLTPTDQAGGAGVAKTFYKLDDDASYTESTANPVEVVIDAPSDHSNDGEHTIYYYSTDNAGNEELTKTASVKIDTEAPTVEYTSAAPDANANGWRNVDVVATFTATDNLSGFDGPSTTKTGTSQTTGEGTAVTVGSPAFTDRAGNTVAADAAVSDEFKIDKTKPTVEYTSATPAANANGWRNVDVTATFTATDNLSGFAGPSSTKTGTADTSGEGEHVTVGSPEFEDLAGNTAALGAATSAEFKIDKTKPVLSNLGPTTSPNAAGWFNANVANRFKATDGLSGLDNDCKTAFPADGSDRIQSKSTTDEGVDVKVTSDACTDLAGNTAAAIDSAAFKIDKTKPVLSDLGPTTSPNDAGWYKTNVVNRFKASEGLSGPNMACATAFPEVSGERIQSKTTSGEGTDVKVSSDPCTDVAGNTAAAIMSAGFKVDKTNPTLNPVVTPNPVTLGGAATVASNADDALSTLHSQSCGSLNTASVGSKSVTCTATDKAGNTDSKSVSYSVQYGWGGFLQPINDTAHQTGLTQSRFKLGSTVPAKFVLTNSAGEVVQQATNPTFSRTNRLRACDANAVTEPTTSDVSPDGGASYAWDGAQYHYNWSTKGIKDPGVYRIYANLADTTQRWVDICLW
jgi:hypothetical protein